IKNSIKEFQSGYNAIIDLTTAYGSEQGLSKKLLSRLTDITAPYKNDLEACGLSFDDTGKMQLTDSLLTDSIESSELNPHFSSTGFLGRLGRQLNGISINPMEYVDKTLILYPNPLRTCTSPYTASKYSGMLFNYYC
ncbi:MAG: flagellar hook-associated protein 2, partial [Clostridiales bacterium]|nr:flagellar hook-associated protein 2 [Clostridiales bacterium]